MPLTIDKETRITRFNPHAKLHAKVDGDTGYIEGYAAVFGNVDQQGESIRKGAFAKTIQDRVPAGKCKLMVRHFAHGGDTLEVIGTITEAKEDEFGLWIHAELSGVQIAQDTRQKVTEGHVKGLSVGYNVMDWGFVEMDGKADIIELRELRLLEVTVTANPANELAAITAAKALERAAELTGTQAAEASDSDRHAPVADIRELAKSAHALAGQLDAMLEPHETETTADPAADFLDMENELRGNNLFLQQLEIE